MTKALILLTAVSVCAAGAALAQSGDLKIFGANPGGAVDASPPRALNPPRQPSRLMQASSKDLINSDEVFIAVGARKTQELAIKFAREYYKDFRSASAAFLTDGRWVALIGWTSGSQSNQLLRELRFAGRIPNGSFVVAPSLVETVVWSASNSISRQGLRILGNIRRTPILTGMGITGTWGATPAACANGFNRDDLLEGTLQIGARRFSWGSFGNCSLGSIVRVNGGVFVGAVCGRESNQDRFVMSLRRRGAKLEVITDPVKSSKIYYQLDWCSRQGGEVAGGSQLPRQPSIARAPGNPGAMPRSSSAVPGTPPRRRSRSTGSGFFVSASGHLVTNQHVVRKCDEVSVKGFGQAQLIHADSYNDLALLKLNPRKSVPYLKLRTQPVQLGQEIVVFGYPLSSILNNGLNVTTGVISSETGIRNDQRMLQFTAAIQPGNSGGPVVDRAGNLVAVVRSKFSDKFALDRGNFVPQTLNFGIKTGILMKFLANNGITAEKSESGKDRSVADLAAAAKAHTMLVTCH